MPANICTDFDEIALCVPRPAYFAGDCIFDSSSKVLRAIDTHYDLESLSVPCDPRSTSALGSLCYLPLEILHDILGHTDILSVLAFFQVNRTCSTVVTSSSDFAVVARFPKVLSVVVGMQCRFFSLRQLATSLIDTRCSRCEGGHFGDLLYLIKGERICWPCWRHTVDSIPVNASVVKRIDPSQMPPEAFSEVPHVLALAGLYGIALKMAHSKGATAAYDRRAVLAALESYGIDAAALRPEPFQLRTGRGYESWRPRLPLPEKFLPFLQVPYWDRETQSYKGGYFCRACVRCGVPDYNARYTRRWRFPELVWHVPWRRYTREGFWEHVQKYGQIMKHEDGTLAHDSVMEETQSMQDVQWEMYFVEDELFAESPDLSVGQGEPHTAGRRPLLHSGYLKHANQAFGMEIEIDENR